MEEDDTKLAEFLNTCGLEENLRVFESCLEVSKEFRGWGYVVFIDGD